MSLTLKVARTQSNGNPMPGIGDPGLFGSIGNILGKVAGVAKIIPGPIGAGAALAQRALTTKNPKAVPGAGTLQAQLNWHRQIAAGTLPGMQQPQMPVPGFRGAAQRFFPGGETGMQDAPPVGAPSGYHVNKTAYFLKDGTYIPEQSRWVRNRRRNPLNPRAASKAIGRIEALKRATSRFSRITIRKKPC